MRLTDQHSRQRTGILDGQAESPEGGKKTHQLFIPNFQTYISIHRTRYRAQIKESEGNIESGKIVSSLGEHFCFPNEIQSPLFSILQNI